MAALSNSRCVFNSRAALQRVFFAAAPPTAAPLHRARHLAAATSQARTYAKPAPRRGPRGPSGAAEAAEVEGGDERGFSRLFTTAKDIERSQKDRMPQDFEITDPRIMVLENGAIAGPLSTKYVMSKLDDKTESLRMIRPYIPKGTPLRKGKAVAEAGGGGGGAAAATAENPVTKAEEFALCEIVNKFEAFRKAQELKERKKANAKPKSKELELTWSISEHDLETKLRHLSKFLAKGMKVNLVLGSKKGSRPVAADQMHALVKRVRKEAQDLDAREAAPATGEVGKTMRLFYEGVVKTESPSS